MNQGTARSEAELATRARWSFVGIMILILSAVTIIVTILDNGSRLLGAEALGSVIAVLLIGFAIGRARARRRKAT